MIQILETIEAFEGLKGIWKRLETSGRIFQTFDWCFFAWKNYYISGVEKLWILVWQRDGGTDCVIFPWFIDAKGCLRFIMDTHSDALDAVYEHNGINRALCYKEVAEAIRAEPRIHSCHFQKLCGDSECLHYLGVYLPAPMIYRDNAYSYFALPQSNDVISQMTHMRTKDRAVVKSFARKSAQYDYHVYSLDQGVAFPEVAIIQMRAQLLAHTARTIVFLPDELLVFSRDIYNRKMCEIATLEQNGQIVALSFRLCHRDRLLSWLFLYTDPHATTLLDARYLVEKAKTGAYLYDFGVGVYDYKIGNFRPNVEVTFSLRTAKTFIGWIKNEIAMTLRFAKDYYKARRRISL